LLITALFSRAPSRAASAHGKPPRLGARAIVAVWLACGAGCQHDPPPVAPGQPIPAAPDVTLATMDVECNGLLAALAAYKDCPNLDDDDRVDIDAWTEQAQQDFAAGKKANPEPNAQRAIAAACHKAIASVAAANERCHNGPKPVQ
jgi:hypothetical protein